MTTENFANFNEAYAALSKANSTLEQMREPNVDAIAPCVETAVLAADFCMKRISAVRAIVDRLETESASKN